MDEYWTEDAHRALELAAQEADRLQHDSLRTEHILVGLIQQGCVAAGILNALGIEPSRIRQEVERLVQPGIAPTTRGQLGRSRLAKVVLRAASEEARNLALACLDPGEHLLGYSVGPKALLLGLLHEPKGVAAQALMNLRLTLEGMRAKVHEKCGATKPEVRNLSEAEMGKLPAETRRALTELSAQIEQLNKAKEAAVVAQDFETAAHLRDQADDLDRTRNALIRECRGGGGAPEER
jgi:ATP-dependent Clp protease ATP-binding subunit ClpC